MAKKPIEFVEIEVDGKPLTLRQDQVLLWSLRDKGFDIPHFCAHQWLEPFAGCRMCMVEIEMGGRMMPKLQPSCAMRPAEGMKVFTATDKVIKSRREQIEFHLINHPLECPVCDKGGECMLQDQVYAHGADQGRYLEEKRVRPDKLITDYIHMNYKRCIQCKRCVHFCQDIDGSHLIKFVERGAETRIEGFPKEGVADRFSGNTIDICPVGALTARSYRFMGRPWEQDLIASVGSLDSVGANINLCGRLGEVARIIPRNNSEVEDGYIDDVTRFSWECIDDPRRVEKAIVRKGDGSETVTRYEAEKAVAAELSATLGEHGPDSIGVIAGGGLNNEEYLALHGFCNEVLDTKYFHFGADLLGDSAGSQQALWSITNSYTPIANILECSTVLSIGCDLFEEAPPLGLRLDIAARRGLLQLFAARSHGSEADRFAKAVGYNYGNQLKFILDLTNAVKGDADTSPEAQALAAGLKEIGEDLAIIYGSEIWNTPDPAELVCALENLKDAVATANPDAQGVYLCPVFPEVNSAGAMLTNCFEAFTNPHSSKGCKAVGSLKAVLKAAADGKLKQLLIFDTDLLATYPDRSLVRRAMQSVQNLFYIGPFENVTSELAAVHLPLGTSAHREGSVLSLEWRLQQRQRAAISSKAPGVFEIANSLTVLLDKPRLAGSEDELANQLSQMVEGWPGCGGIPEEGVLLKLSVGEKPVGSAASAPAEVRGTADSPFVVIPKRFLYNDRAEVRFSPVFDKVAKPFYAYFNPTDAKVQNLENVAAVTLVGSGAELELTVQIARWVRPGSVVINDYNLAAQANHICGVTPATVFVKRKVEAGS